MGVEVGITQPPARWRIAVRAMCGAVLLVVLLGCVVGAPNRAAWVGPVPATWSPYEAPGRGLRASLPGPVAVESSEGHTFDGEPIRTTTGLAHAGGLSCGFSIVENASPFVGDPVEETDAVDYQRLLGADGTIRADHRDFDRGFPIRDVTFESGEMTLRARSYVGRRRLYSVWATYRTVFASQAAASVDHYFGSLTLDAADASAASGDGVLRPDGWAYVYPAGAYFAALMPGHPSLAREQTTLRGRERDTLVAKIHSTDGARGYGVRVIEWSGRPGAAAWTALRDDYIGRGMTVQDEAPITQQGFAGHRYLLRGAGRQIETRIVLGSSRVFEATASVALDGERVAVDTTADDQRFFASFRVQ